MSMLPAALDTDDNSFTKLLCSGLKSCLLLQQLHSDSCGFT
jgi:hypothetical protein